MIYWDTSALIKLYAPEPDSSYFLSLLRQKGQPLFSSEITQAEVLCTLYRKEHAGDLIVGAAERLFDRFSGDVAAGRLTLIPNGVDVMAEARTLVSRAYSQPQPILIRGLDAIHIASALTGPAVTVVATDTRLRDVATLMRLEVLP